MGNEVYKYFADKHDFNCRIYAPIGGYNELLPYLVRRLLENGANTSFIYQLHKQDI
jgi:RHH-type proline utilization regulon transcriptional repressor/proline dehydrogenase/delta 1-pyrroline-5-carboxylate dehydrogenase